METFWVCQLLLHADRKCCRENRNERLSLMLIAGLSLFIKTFILEQTPQPCRSWNWHVWPTWRRWKQNNCASVETNPSWQSPTLCHLTFMESQQSASTPPGAVVNRTPAQLFLEGLQVIQLQRCEENHHQCNWPLLCCHSDLIWHQVTALTSLLICPHAWKEIRFFCCLMGTNKSCWMQLPDDACEFGFQPTPNALQLQAAELG